MSGKVSIAAARALIWADQWSHLQPRCDADIKDLNREVDWILETQNSWVLDCRLAVVKLADGWYIREPSWTDIARQNTKNDYLMDRLRDSEIDRYQSIIEDLA